MENLEELTEFTWRIRQALTEQGITGANGQLGHSLQQTAPELAELICTDVAELDICDAAAVNAFVAQHRPELILNAAAYTAVDKAESDEATAFAAGHRPCAFCRRSRYTEFKSAWLAANPGLVAANPPVAEIDRVLQRELTQVFRDRRGERWGGRSSPAASLGGPVCLPGSASAWTYAARPYGAREPGCRGCSWPPKTRVDYKG